MASDSSTVPDGADPARDMAHNQHARAGGLIRASSDLQGIAIQAGTTGDLISDSTRSDSRLVERSAAISQLRTLVAADETARGYPSGVLVIEGLPGVGRTALLNTACELAHRSGTRVLRARGSEQEAAEPLGVLKQVIAQLHAAGSLAPSVRAMLDRASQAPVDAAALHRLFESVDEALVAHAGARTVLVAVDDLHWSDQTSVMWLGYLARRVDLRPAHIVVTMWPLEPSRSATPLDRLLTDAATRRMHLNPLSAEGVSYLVDQRFGRSQGARVDEGLAAACYEATHGNPALLFALLDALSRTGPTPLDADAVDRLLMRHPPADVTRSVLRRVHMAGPSAIAVLEAVHILGESATHESIAAVADIDSDEGHLVIRQLRGAGLVTANDPLTFTHPLEQSAFRAVIPPARERDLHQRASQHLVASNAPPRDVADHLLGVAPASEATHVAILREAAAAAIEVGDHRAARGYLLRALDEPPPSHEAAEVRLELALCEVRAGSAEAAERVRAVRNDLPSPAVVANAAPGLVVATRAVRARARELVRSTADAAADQSADVRNRLGVTEALLVNPSQARALLARVIADPAAPSETSDLYRLAVIQRANAAAASPGRTTVETVTHDITTHLQAGDLTSSDPLSYVIARQAVVTLMRIGEHDPARRLLAAALRHPPADQTRAAVLVRLAARVAHERGQGSRAQALRDRYERIESPRVSGFHSLLAAWSAELLALERRYDEALSALDAARELADPAEHWMIEPFAIDETAGWIHIWRGHAAEALTAFRRASGLAEASGVDNPAIATWRSGAVFALTQLEDVSHAVDLAGEEVERAKAFGVEHVTARALLAFAGTLPQGERIKVLHEAIEHLVPQSPVVSDVRLRIACGWSLIECGDTTTARAVLRVAADNSQRLNIPGLMERSRSALRAAGARPRRLAITGPAALTPAENRVVMCAADGLTNAAIADELFINVKTVESHLARAFRKLGVTSRTALAEALNPDGPAN